MWDYNSKYRGQWYRMVDGEIFQEVQPGKFASANPLTGKEVAVQLTGYYKTSTMGNQMQLCTNGGYINLSSGWQYEAYSPLSSGSTKDAQRYVNGVIKNNARIYENNLICARFANHLTEGEKEKVRELQNRLEYRNSRLLDSGLVDNQKVGTPPGYNQLAGYLNALMNNTQGVGLVISTTTALVVGAVVIAIVSAAAYFVYKTLFYESEEDVRFSDDLTKKLTSVLTEEEYQQLLEETKGLVTKAELRGKFSSIPGILKWGLIGLGVFALYKAISSRRSQQ